MSNFLFTDWDEEQATRQIEKTSKQQIRLRPYQLAAVDAVYDEWQTVRSTMVNIPTGGGKSVVFSEVMRRWDISTQGKILLIAHRKELILQAIGHAMRAGLSSGMEMAGRHASGDEDVIVASVQTLNATRKCGRCFGEGCDECYDGKVKRFTRFNPRDFGLLVCDEYHHFTAKSNRNVLTWFAQNPLQKTLGVTATPRRADKQGLHNICESVAYRMELREAIDEGWLVPIRQKFVTVEGLDISKVKIVAGKLNEGQVEAAFLGTDEDEERMLHSIVKPTIDEAAGRKTLVFAAGKDHANKLASCFAAHGVEAGVVVEDTDPTERSELINRYSNGDLQVLVNCLVLCEGFDAPITEIIANCRPTKSESLYCLDEHTQVLTPSGWKGIDDKFDSLVSVDRELRCYSSYVVARIERELNAGERFYGVNGRMLDVCVTDKHTMIAATRYGRQRSQVTDTYLAANMPREFKLPVAARWKYATESALKDEELRFIGLVMTDGTINKYTSQIVISQSERHPECIEYIREVLSDCGFKYTESTRNDDTNFGERKFPIHTFTISKGLPRGTDKHLTGYERIAFAVTKHFNDELKLLSRNQLLVLLEAMNVGDGAKFKCPSIYWTPRTMSICSARSDVVDAIQAACVTNGIRCTLGAKNSNGVNNMLIDPTREWVFLSSESRDTRQVWGEIDSKSRRVWCVQSEHGFLITRRFGKVAVVGNCQIIGRATRPLAGVVDGPETAEERKAAIAASDKDSCTILDFVGNSGDIKLISVADVLAGDSINPIDLAEALRVATKSGETVDMEELAEKMKQARLEAEERKEIERRQRLLTNTKADRADYSTVDVDLFGGPTFATGDKYVEPITKGQQGFLYHQLGMTRKQTKHMSRKQASAIIGKTYKQAGDDWKRMFKEANSLGELRKVGDAISARKSSDYLMGNQTLIDSLRAAYNARRKELGEQ